MARGAQKAINGMAVDHQKGRFAGTFDLEDFEVDSSGLDETVVCVVVARVQGSNPKITKKGELDQVTSYGVTDMRVVDPELRSALVDRLGLMDTSQLPLFDSNGQGPVADVTTGELPLETPVLEPVEPVEVEVQVPSDEPAHVDPPETPQGEQVGSVYAGLHRRDPELVKFMDA